MRQINWDEPLSDDDVAWLRGSGILNVEDAIRRNQAQFVDDGADEDADDYDQWKVSELQAEADSRDPRPVVTGTGKNGAVTKADLIAALRVWDQENEEA